MSKWQFSTLQANHAEQGNYALANTDISGIGVGIYVGVLGDVEIQTIGGDTVVYTQVPQGTFMQVPLFSKITSGTTSTDLTIATMKSPYR